MTDTELDEINQQISALFTDRPLDDVATILTIQLGMLIMQGSANGEEAHEFLGEITDQVEDMIDSYDFDGDDGDDGSKDAAADRT